MPKNKAPLANASPPAVNGVNSANDAGPPARRVDVAEKVFTAIRTLASGVDFKEVESLLAEIPLLRDKVQDKDKEIADLMMTHKEFLRENLQVYNEDRDRLEAEINELKKEISFLKENLWKRDKTVADLEKKDSDTEAIMQRLGKSLEQQNEAAKKAEDEIKNLEREVKAKDTSISRLEGHLTQEESRALELKNVLEDLKEENISLSQRFQTSDDRLKELEDLAEPLRDTDTDAL